MWSLIKSIFLFVDGVAPVDFTSPFSSPETAPATTVPTTKKPTPDKSSLIDDDFLSNIFYTKLKVDESYVIVVL